MKNFRPGFNSKVVVLGLLAASAVSAPSRALGAETKKTLSKVTLGLNWKAEPEFGGFYAAKLGGRYEKNGLDVEVIEGGAGTPVIQMVASGRMEFGISAADEVALSQDRGSDVIALFAAYKTNPQGVMVHPERGFKSMGDVFKSPGRLAIAGGAPYTLFLQRKFKEGAQVKLVPFAGGVGAFLADSQLSQQCFVTSEPLLVKKSGVKAATFLIADEGFDPYATVLITRRATYEKDPARVKAFVNAVREGWVDYLAAPGAANEAMAKLNTSMDRATFDAIEKEQRHFVLGKDGTMADLGKMELPRWQEIVGQLQDLKLLKKKLDPKRLFLEL